MEPTDLDVAIIGAGLSGLYALHALRSLGLRVHAFDQAGDVGGTWWWNRYPGARVDSPGAPFYGYTFSEEIARDWAWTETQPDQPSILAYLRYVADRLDLRRDISLGTHIANATFDSLYGRWRLRTSTQADIVASFLLCATGTLSQSYLPPIQGIVSFAGTVLHTGHWPEPSPELAGKRIGVIGTGSSGVQVIPFLARAAQRLTVFQRTAQFVIPGRNRPIDYSFQAMVQQDWDRYRAHMIATGRPIPLQPARAMCDGPVRRAEKYESAWQRGGLDILSMYTDHLTDPVANGYVADFVRQKIREIVKDPSVAAALNPQHLFGTKRLILGEGYYETYNHSNVQLVDLRNDPIERIEPTGIATASGFFPLDVLVLATGYDAMTGALLSLNPVGVSGDLRSKWRDGVSTYLGLAVAGFPNMFLVHGPQTPSVKFHMGLGAEFQCDWIADCISYMERRGYARFDVDPKVEAEWRHEVQATVDGTLYLETPSWFNGGNIPGKPREFLIHLDWPGYQRRLREVRTAGYAGLTFEWHRDNHEIAGGGGAEHAGADKGRP